MHFTVAMISRDLSEVPERIQKELIKKKWDFIAKKVRYRRAVPCDRKKCGRNLDLWSKFTDSSVNSSST